MPGGMVKIYIPSLSDKFFIWNPFHTYSYKYIRTNERVKAVGLDKYFLHSDREKQSRSRNRPVSKTGMIDKKGWFAVDSGKSHLQCRGAIIEIKYD